MFGHTHLQFRRVRARTASSCSTRAASGCRSTATRARPTRLAGDDGAVEHRRVAYDHERSAAAVRERFGDADVGAAQPSAALLTARL